MISRFECLYLSMFFFFLALVKSEIRHVFIRDIIEQTKQKLKR